MTAHEIRELVRLLQRLYQESEHSNVRRVAKSLITLLMIEAATPDKKDNS